MAPELVLFGSDRSGLRSRRSAGARGGAFHGATPRQTAIGYAHRKLGPELDPPAGIPIYVRGTRGQRDSAAMADGIAEAYSHHRHSNQRTALDGADLDANRRRVLRIALHAHRS